MPRTIQILTLLLLAACTAGRHASPRTLYRNARRDMAADRSSASLMTKTRERMERRYDKIMDLFDQGQLKSQQDLLYSAALLVTSDQPNHLDRAFLLSNEAAAIGEKRALPVSAEAEDKLLLLQGLPQRYGTQYAYEPSRGRWRLYSVNPATTDAERAAVGIPPLADLQARVDELDEQALTKLLVSRVPE